MCPGNIFFSNFGSQLGPWGGVHEVTFSKIFELWAVLGPKCFQERSQESPKPPQASICKDLETFWSDIADFATP